MKTKFTLVLLLSLSFFTSCKNDEKKIDEVKKEDSKNVITISFNAVVKKDDGFQIFYTEDGSENFTGDQSVLVAVKGSEQPQDIVFELPQNVFPKMIRFDLGGNKNQDEVAFNNFRINYLDKNFTAKGNQLSNYFYENKQILVNKEKGTAKPVPTEGQEYDPIFMATQALKDELAKIVK
jgi:hypothetical protein